MTRPTIVAWASGARAFSLGDTQLYILDAHGLVRCGGESWPNGLFGCGDEYCGRDKPGAALVKELADAVQLTTLGLETCALRRDHTVVCWGEHLGLAGARSPQLAPMRVPGIDDARAMAGSCVLRASGKVACWGHVAFPRGVDQPTEVPGVERADALPESGGLRCALSVGRAICWDPDGEILGTNPRSRPAPTRVELP